MHGPRAEPFGVRHHAPSHYLPDHQLGDVGSVAGQQQVADVTEFAIGRCGEFVVPRELPGERVHQIGQAGHIDIADQVVGHVGAAGGAIVARYKVAPFITTLSVMMMARGLAFMFTGGFSIYQVPPALPWLGQGRTIGIPNTVMLLVVRVVNSTKGWYERTA